MKLESARVRDSKNPLPWQSFRKGSHSKGLTMNRFRKLWKIARQCGSENGPDRNRVVKSLLPVIWNGRLSQ